MMKDTTKDNEKKRKESIEREDSSDCLLCRYFNNMEDIDSAANEDKTRLSSAKSGKSIASPSGIKSVTISENIHSRSCPGSRRRNGRFHVEPDMNSEHDGMDYDQISVLRGKANTPASLYTEFPELKDADDERQSPDPSQVTGNARDAMYQKAIHLMTERCASSNQHPQGWNLPLVADYDPPVGVYTPQYFYVKQRKPVPMPPLKAWRGYNGNVYFEPIHVSQASVSPAPPATPKPNTSRKASAKSAHSRRGTAMSRHSTSTLNSKHNQMVMLDKRSVLSRMEGNSIKEDLVLIMGQESTGSLCMEPPSPHNNKSKKTYNKEKICKGSNTRSSSGQRKGFPFLSVSGDKFIPSVMQSPLLRTQTQYSLSNQRLTMNSPSPEYYTSYTNSNTNTSKLPPLEQLHASLKRMDNSNTDDVTDGARLEEQRNQKYPPYIRYSAEIKPKGSKQLTRARSGQKVM